MHLGVCNRPVCTHELPTWIELCMAVYRMHTTKLFFYLLWTNDSTSNRDSRAQINLNSNHDRTPPVFQQSNFSIFSVMKQINIWICQHLGTSQQVVTGEHLLHWNKTSARGKMSFPWQWTLWRVLKVSRFGKSTYCWALDEEVYISDLFIKYESQVWQFSSLPAFMLIWAKCHIIMGR